MKILDDAAFEYAQKRVSEGAIQKTISTELAEQGYVTAQGIKITQPILSHFLVDRGFRTNAAKKKAVKYGA